MDKRTIYESILHPAARQALIWGGGSYLAHKAARLAQSQHDTELKKFKPVTKVDKKEDDLKKKLSKKQALATTLGGAAAGALGAIV